MNVFAKCLFVSSLFLLGGFAHAQNVHGVLRVVKGDVQIKSAKTGQTGKARLGAQVYPKDTIITGKDARAKIVMVDNNEINVSPESQIEIQNYEFDPAAGKKDVLLNVIYGKVRSKVEQKYDGKTTKFQIKTPTAVAGVRGTDFLMAFNSQSRSTSVTTFEGNVAFGTPGPGGTISNPVMVGPGTQATSVAGAGPSAPKPMPKEELAKVDGESKADGPGAGSSGNGDSRQPAEDKKEKKDDAKKEDGAAKNDGAKKEDGAKKNDGAQTDTGKSANNNKQNTQREPASPQPGPSSGCTMCGPPPPLPEPPVALPGPQIPQLPTLPPLPAPCGLNCDAQITNGNVNLQIKVQPK